jgi:hypothetical protein
MNKVGYITNHETVIYPLRTRMIERSLKWISHRSLFRIINVPKSPEMDERISRFFGENVPNPLLFNKAMRAVATPQGDAFFENPIKLPKLEPLSREERDVRWGALISSLKSGDLLQVFDSESKMSRLIARFDNGTWSHSATYIGDGRICEATTSGVVERGIESYAAEKFRVGIYRVPGLTELQAERMCSFSKAPVGKPYAWRKVTALALRKVLGMALPIGVPRHTSPNDLVAVYGYELMFLV